MLLYTHPYMTKGSPFTLWLTAVFTAVRHLREKPVSDQM